MFDQTSNFCHFLKKKPQTNKQTNKKLKTKQKNKQTKRRRERKKKTNSIFSKIQYQIGFYDSFPFQKCILLHLQ